MTVDTVDILEIFAEAQQCATLPAVAFASGLAADTKGAGVVAVREWARLNPQRYREAKRAQNKRRRSKAGFKAKRQAADLRYREAHRGDLAAKSRARYAALKTRRQAA